MRKLKHSLIIIVVFILPHVNPIAKLKKNTRIKYGHI